MRTLAGASLVLVGYTLTWWGWRRVTQCSGDLLGLIVPGRTLQPAQCAGAAAQGSLGLGGLGGAVAGALGNPTQNTGGGGIFGGAVGGATGGVQ